MLTFKNVTRLYASNKGLRNCTWKVENNKVVGILGNNGCGKTTTFKLLLQLEDVDEGVILYNNRPINTMNLNEFGYVPEEKRLYQDCIVNDLLTLVGTLKGVDKKDLNKKIDECLQEFDLYDFKYRKVYELSKGNQQILQIIMAILHNPKILILDEPFNGLDKNKLQLVIHLIRNRKGITLISFHQYELVNCICDKVINLKDGCVESIEEVSHD